MEYLLAMLELHGSDSDYMRVIYECLISDGLLTELQASDSKTVNATALNILSAALEQWGQENITDETTQIS